MLTLYIACLLFGGILLTISLFTGGDTDTDMDHSLDAHADFDAHVDFDHSLDVHADVDIGSDMDVGGEVDVHADVGGHADLVEAHVDMETQADVEAGHHGVMASAFEFFSFRNMVYLTTFFGMTGTVLTLLQMPFTLTLASSGVMGVFAAGVGYKFMGYLKDTESGKILDVRDLTGHTAMVILPISKKKKGKISIEIGGREVQLLAMIDASGNAEQITSGSIVLILRFEKDVAYVVEADFVEEVKK